MNVSERHQTRADVAIRAVTNADDEALVAISNAIFPDAPGTVAEWRFGDEHWDAAKYVRQRYVAYAPSTGRPLGYASFNHIPWNFHPQKFEVRVRVHPAVQRQGIGTRLWMHLVEVLKEHQAAAVRTMVRESMSDGVEFALRHGFDEVMRVWESRLAVGVSDLTQFRSALERVEAAGVTITTLAAERDRRPDWLERLYALHSAIGKDIPAPDQFTPPDFRLFTSYVVESPSALPDAHFIAQADGEYVGFSNLFKPEIGDWFIQGTTGVLRAYRGRGIATALKVRTVEYAKARGIREIRTWNEIRNVGILAINERFGFVRQPAWIHYEKQF